MLSMRTSTTVLALSAYLSPIYALSILSPFPGTDIDPTQPITIQWTSLASDPSTFDLKIDDSNANSLSTNQVLASGVSTSSGSFTIPANTIQIYGTGYQIQALSSGGNVLATAGNLVLGASSGSVSTASNGQISFVSTATAAQTSGSTNAGATTTAATAMSTTEVQATSSFQSASATGGTTILSGTVTAESTSPTAIATSTKSSGFVTSSTSRTSTSTNAATAAATSAANTNTANSLGRSRSGGEIVMGAAGVLAGLVALIV